MSFDLTLKLEEDLDSARSRLRAIERDLKRIEEQIMANKNTAGLAMSHSIDFFASAEQKKQLSFLRLGRNDARKDIRHYKIALAALYSADEAERLAILSSTSNE